MGFQAIGRNKETGNIEDVIWFDINYTKSKKFDAVAQHCMNLMIDMANNGLIVTFEKEEEK